MKQQRENLLIGALILLLAISMLLNWLQGNQVTKLMEQVSEMEYTQSMLSSHIEELETTEDEDYGDE